MTRRRSIRRRIAIPLIAGGAAFAAAQVALVLYRRTQLFCPSPDPVKSWNPADYGIDPQAVEELWIDTPDGQRLFAWYCRSKNPRASALFCHGNTGNITVSADIIPHLLTAGLNVLFFDYRGFGKSSGRASVGGVVSDGVTAARFHDRIRPHHLPSVLYGFSLGGAVAAQVIKQHPFDGVILQSTFTSLPDITRVLFPRLPLHLFAGRFFDTLSVVKRLQIPLLVMHGSSDEVIPSWMAHAIHDACEAKKSIEIIDGGLHKDLYIRDRDTIVEAIRRFIGGLSNDRQQGPLAPARREELVDSALQLLRRTTRRRRFEPQSL